MDVSLPLTTDTRPTNRFYTYQEAPESNMYGCLPCPTCKSEYRFPAKARYTPALKDKIVIVCDNCQLEEEVNCNV